MKFLCAAILLAATALTASPGDEIGGTWRVRFAGPMGHQPRTVGSILLDLRADGDSLTGTSRIGVWPGEAQIVDGKVEGNRITFETTGRIHDWHPDLPLLSYA